MRLKFSIVMLICIICAINFSTIAQSGCIIPEAPYKDCTHLPSEAIALTSEHNNTQLESNKVYYISTNADKNFPSNLNINGATVIICGTGTVTAGNVNFNKGTIIISSASKLKFTNQLHVNSTSALHNFGTLQVEGSINAQSAFTAGNGFFNYFGAVTVTNSFEINSTIINKGSVTVTANTNINGSGNVCMGNSSDWTTANLQNNKTNAFTVPVGTACLRVHQSLTGNNSIATSNKLILCKPTSLNASPNLVGQASVSNNCTDCALPLSSELIYADIKEGVNAIELTWKVSEFSNITAYKVEYSDNKGVFDLVTKLPANEDKKSESTYHIIIEKFNIGHNYVRVSTISTDNKEVELFTRSIRIQEKLNLTIFPNPSTSDKGITILIPGRETTGLIKICDYSGRVIYTQEIDNLKTIHIPVFESGNYLIEFFNGITIYREKFSVM